MKRSVAIILSAILCAGWTHGDPASTFLYTVNQTGYFPASGPFNTFQSMYNLASGYTLSTFGYVNVFPSLTTFSWSVPVSPCASVCGAIGGDYGDYSNGPQNKITPQQVKNITTLSSAQNITLGAFSQGWDAIYDILAGSTQHGTDVFELEIFIRSPTTAQNFCASGAPVGILVDGGITWTVTDVAMTVPPALTPNDYCFIPSNFADVPAATIDIKAMFSYLIAQNKITGNEWFHGLTISAEPRSGAGSFVINSWNMTYN